MKLWPSVISTDQWSRANSMALHQLLPMSRATAALLELVTTRWATGRASSSPPQPSFAPAASRREPPADLRRPGPRRRRALCIHRTAREPCSRRYRAHAGVSLPPGQHAAPRLNTCSSGPSLAPSPASVCNTSHSHPPVTILTEAPARYDCDRPGHTLCPAWAEEQGARIAPSSFHPFELFAEPLHDFFRLRARDGESEPHNRSAWADSTRSAAAAGACERRTERDHRRALRACGVLFTFRDAKISLGFELLRVRRIGDIAGLQPPLGLPELCAET